MRPDRDRITIAILALGGQGGGVLADWILDIANNNGFIAQGTSIPGVAQRTGSTIYYIEMVRRAVAGANRSDPVLAMMPVPGDVDIVIASELMEAGRAILRGFVSRERTTLIGSTHRVYAISEKMALGDGIGSSQRILDAAAARSARFVGFDMADAASGADCPISAIMLGALAASGTLPFRNAVFEDAIRQGGKAVQANLKGFATGIERAQGIANDSDMIARPPEPTTLAGRALHDRVLATLPAPAHAFAIHGVRKLMDYQDRAYAELYLDRLANVQAADDGSEDWRLTNETARHLALWMAYEDMARVADLKCRGTRSARIVREMRLSANQFMTVTEYMHPRIEEVCDALPGRIGTAVLERPHLRHRLEPFFKKGRHVRTTSLRWFVLLQLVASLRRMRRSTLRYAREQARIEAWLSFVVDAAAIDKGFAAEIVVTQGLIKGYGDAFDRGLRNFLTIMTAARPLLGAPDGAARVNAFRKAALVDDKGQALRDLAGALP